MDIRVLVGAARLDFLEPTVITLLGDLARVGVEPHDRCAVDAFGVTQQITYGDGLRQLGVGELELRQVLLDGRVQVQRTRLSQGGGRHGHVRLRA